MTPDAFRRLALSQPKVVEVYCRGRSEFRVLRRSFASLGGPVDSVAMVELTSEQQAMFMQAAPRTFVPVPGGSGWLRATNVVLVCANEATVQSALVVAWRNIVPISLVKPTDGTKIDGEIVDADDQCIGMHGEMAVFIRRNGDPGKFFVRLSTSAGNLVLPAPEMKRVISLLTTAYSMANQQRFDGRFGQEGATDNTLKGICEEYIKGDGKALRSVGWREKVLKRLLYPELGAKQIGDIKRSDIVQFLDKIEDENGATMADRTLAVLRKVMNWHASRSDDFRSPIVRGMDRVRQKERARERTLTDDELRAVWRAAEASKGPFGRLVRFILLTAARRMEAAAMTWGELKGEWTLPASRNITKVDLVRPLSAEACAVLPAQVDGYDYVFTADGRNPISAFSAFKLTLDKAIFEDLQKQYPEAKPLPNWTLRDLRRTARSLMCRAGVRADHAERCLGRVMPGVRPVYDPYEYLEEKRDAFNKLAASIKGIVHPSKAATAASQQTQDTQHQLAPNTPTRREPIPDKAEPVESPQLQPDENKPERCPPCRQAGVRDPTPIPF
jgi:integrase